MSKPYQIQADSILVIPDVHEYINWTKNIINKELGNYGHIVFLGDFLDSKSEFAVGCKETCKFILEVQSGVYGPATCLLGNHDQQYMECWAANQKFQRHRGQRYGCGGFSNGYSIKVNKCLNWSDWLKFELFCEFDGCLMSHAGINERLWDFGLSREENLDKLYIESRLALENIKGKHSRLLQAGFARGGFDEFGGLTWQDWDDEYIHNEIIGGQIVGHTKKTNTARNKEFSWVLDGGQTTYGILSKTAGLQVKSLDGTHKVLHD